jgi:hypothetical protein
VAIAIRAAFRNPRSVITTSCATSTKTTGQVTRIGRFQSGIGQTFTGTVGGDEVLKDTTDLL